MSNSRATSALNTRQTTLILRPTCRRASKCSRNRCGNWDEVGIRSRGAGCQPARKSAGWKPAPRFKRKGRMTQEECALLRDKHYNATVVYLKQVHEDLMIVRICPDFPVPAHKPGQYSTLGMGQWEPRHSGCQEENVKPGEEKKLIR